MNNWRGAYIVPLLFAKFRVAFVFALTLTLPTTPNRNTLTLGDGSAFGHEDSPTTTPVPDESVNFLPVELINFRGAMSNQNIGLED